MSQTKAQLIDPVDGTIVNADINASAAIAGTKISPDFGSQAISTTGGLSINGATVFNESGADVDFRIEGDTLANLFYVDAGNDRIGIGTSSPATLLQIESTDPTFRVKRSDGSAYGELTSDTSGLISFKSDPGNTANGSGFIFTVDNSEKARMDSAGRLLLGASTSAIVGGGGASLYQIETTSQNAISCVAHRGTGNASGSIFILGKSRGTSAGAVTSVGINDELGSLRFAGADDTDLQSRGGEISCEVDGTPGSNDMPGRLLFKTTADGSAAPTERMRISSNGDARIGGGTPATFGSGTTVFETYNANNFTANLVTSGTHQLQMIASQTHGVTSMGTRSNHNLNLSTNDSTRLTITTAGNVGIGLTNPTSTLQVDGDVRTTNRLGVGTAANFANIVSYVTGTGSYPPSGGLVQADNADSTAMFWNASNSANYTGLSIECRTTGAAYWMLANVYNSSFSGDLAFRTRTGGSANAERVRFRREGGITFNGDTAAANALDDYEEGTWAPAISAGGTDFTVVASGCTYTKIGNTVFFYFDILQNHSGNITEIFDLPFTVAKHGTFRIGWISNSQQGAQGSSDMAGGLISNGNSALSFRPSGGNTNINIPAGTRFIGSGFYQTS